MYSASSSIFKMSFIRQDFYDSTLSPNVARVATANLNLKRLLISNSSYVMDSYVEEKSVSKTIYCALIYLYVAKPMETPSNCKSLVLYVDFIVLHKCSTLSVLLEPRLSSCPHTNFNVKYPILGTVNICVDYSLCFNSSMSQFIFLAFHLKLNRKNICVSKD